MYRIAAILLISGASAVLVACTESEDSSPGNAVSLAALLTPDDMCEDLLLAAQRAVAEIRSRSNQPQLSAEARAQLRKWLIDGFGFLERTRSSMARFYAQEFSPQQLAELNRFFASEVGQRYVRSGPRALQQALPRIMQELQRELLTAIERITSEASD